MNIDETNKNFLTRKEFAHTLVYEWAKQELTEYQEPVRAGVQKGYPIGFPRAKKAAALYMVLHPNVARLREIADMAGVPLGSLTAWNTQDDFRKECAQAHERFTEELWKTFQIWNGRSQSDACSTYSKHLGRRHVKPSSLSSILNNTHWGEKTTTYVLNSIGCLNEKIGNQLEKESDKKPLFWIHEKEFLKGCSWQNRAVFKRWLNAPLVTEQTKANIANQIAAVKEAAERGDIEKVNQVAGSLQEFVFAAIDSLSATMAERSKKQECRETDR